MTRFAFITRILAALPLLGWLFRERETVEYPYDDFPDGEQLVTHGEIGEHWERLDVPVEGFRAHNATLTFDGQEIHGLDIPLPEEDLSARMEGTGKRMQEIGRRLSWQMDALPRKEE